MKDLQLVAQTISIAVPFGVVIGLMIAYSLLGGSGSSSSSKEDG